MAEFVTVAVPALNEEKYIANFVRDLLAALEGSGEVLVLDGGSSDNTKTIVRALAAEDPRVRLADNPGRIQSAALNLAARLASPQAKYMVRADAHCRYPRHFISACCKGFEKGATSVVVPMATVGVHGFQKAAATAQNSILGNGGAAHRHRASAKSGFVEHGHHAAFDLAFFRKIGGYDESFPHNEDAEFDHRALKAGGRIWMCAEARIEYAPRRSLAALAKQYYRFGRGRAKTMLKHRVWPKLRQVLPVVVFATCAASALIGLVSPFYLVPLLAYLAICLVWAAGRAIRDRNLWVLASGAALVCMHWSWGAGFLRESLLAPRAH